MRPSVFGLFLGLSLASGLVGCASQHGARSGPLAPPTGAQAASVDDRAAAGTPGTVLASGPTTDATTPHGRDGDRPRHAAEANDGTWLGAATASDFMLAGASDQSFGVWIDVPKGAATEHVPTALALVIDTSGSMSGDKIAHAQEAARRLVDELEEGDQLSIVTFDDRGRVRIAPTVIDARSRRLAHNVIEELSANGGTAMFEGLKVAESQMWGTPDTHLVRRMVVISDGQATEGPTSPDELGRVAEVGLQRGIQVTSIGVGLDYDESTLNALAIRSSGRLYHVEHSEQLPGIIAEEVALLESTAATDVEVELVAAPGVRILGTDTAQSRWGNDSLIVPIGAVFAGQQRELLVRARVDEAHQGTKVLASIRMHFRDPTEEGLRRVQETIVRATVTDDPSLVAAHTHSRTQTLIAMREASMFSQQAAQRANEGDLDQADLELARAEKKLHEQAKVAKTAEEKQRVMSAATRVSKRRKDVAKAKSAPAPARAKASRAIALESNDDAMAGMGY